MKVGIIGGGAAGFFAALSVKEHHPKSEVTILEKSSKFLSKVKVSGGGRCNVTHSCFQISTLAKQYPRGQKQMKKLLAHFNVEDTINWFEQRDIQLKTEADGRMFPLTDNSQTIIDCFLKEASRQKIKLRTRFDASEIEFKVSTAISITSTNGEIEEFDKVILACGGLSKSKHFDWIRKHGYQIEEPAPSLFTFNIQNPQLHALQGLSLTSARVKIQSTKYIQEGPVLITHWGLSGPAVLKTSAQAAKYLNEVNYKFKIHIGWIDDLSEADAQDFLNKEKQKAGKRKVLNHCPLGIPARFWEYLTERASIPKDMRWNGLHKKSINRLAQAICNDEYEVNGKTTFKEEFVTCGGISWANLNLPEMRSKLHPQLYFAGELLNVDGYTGGFNFQAAWTTGFLAGRLK